MVGWKLRTIGDALESADISVFIHRSSQVNEIHPKNPSIFLQATHMFSLPQPGKNVPVECIVLLQNVTIASSKSSTSYGNSDKTSVDKTWVTKLDTKHRYCRFPTPGQHLMTRALYSHLVWLLLGSEVSGIRSSSTNTLPKGLKSNHKSRKMPKIYVHS